MGLFGIFKKKAENEPAKQVNTVPVAKKVSTVPVAKRAEAPGRRMLFEQHFKQSKGFRGYKRHHVSYYGYKPAEEGIAKMREQGWNLDDADIFLQGFEANGNRYILVTVNDCFIGTVFYTSLDEEQIERIEQQLYTGKVDGAHLLVEYQNVIDLSDPNSELTQREKIKLLLHFPEE